MRNRGFSWIGLVAILGAITALIFAINYGYGMYRSSIADADSKGYKRGQFEADAAYKARDNAQLQALIKERDALQLMVDAKQKELNDAVASKEAVYAKKLAEQQKDFDQFVSDVNAGRIVWRDPGQAGGRAACDGKGAAGEAPADSRGGDGSVGGGIISGETVLFLRSEARRADAVVGKLNLCRGVLRDIYEVAR